MNEQDRLDLASLNVRLFGLDGTGGLYGDVQDIKTELAEWRGAIRIVRYGGTLLGIGGISAIIAALANLR